MSIYENNLKVIQIKYPEIYNKISHISADRKVYIGDAGFQGKFLAVEEKSQLIALQSTYDPEHEADCYLKQFDPADKRVSVILFGFGTGLIIEKMLNRIPQINSCFVVEPSPAIFRTVLENYDITKILSDPRLTLFIDGINTDRFKNYLYDHLNMYNFKTYQYVCLSKYRELYPVIEKRIKSDYDWVCDYCEANYNTMLRFSVSGPKNAIYAFRFLMHAKSIFDIQPYLVPDVPCIIVAAGPSLSRNIQELSRAKGKAFIICVDSAANYCASQGIMPDVICVVDPSKSDYFSLDASLYHVPLLTCTAADQTYLKKSGIPEVLYFSVDCDLHDQVLQRFGYDLPCTSSNGSVATSAFQVAVDLGFRTIILVGQDLAYSSKQMYAGDSTPTLDQKMKATIEAWGLYEVEGYQGNTVYTTGDFYAYLEWFTNRISELGDQIVVNATEGGAKIPGTLQMPLSDAVTRYCNKELDFEEVYAKLPYMIPTDADRRTCYQILQSYQSKLMTLQSKIVQVDMDPNRLQRIIDQVQTGEFRELFHRYMIKAEFEYMEDADISRYMIGLKRAAEFMCDTWNQVMEEIKCLYMKKI